MAPISGAFREIIRQWLVNDQKTPRKQRHTAPRIYHRLCGEHNFQGVESTIRRVVAELRREVEVVVNVQGVDFIGLGQPFRRLHVGPHRDEELGDEELLAFLRQRLWDLPD